MKRRHLFPVAIVVGVPGVGKSTVLELVKEKMRSNGYEMIILNYGDYMLKELKSKGLVEHRDQLRKLPLRIQVEHQANAAIEMMSDALKMLKDPSKSVVVIDTHLIIRTPLGYWPGIPDHVAHEFKADVIILIEAEPEDILKRQLKDTDRVRKDYSNIEVIKEMQNLNRYIAFMVAHRVGSAVKIVYNREGQADDAANEIVSVFKNLVE